jgi:pimeloyl-ACP methyl ester carboxylesterase
LVLVDGYVTVAGLPLHYRESGVGLPLVFVHALGRDASDWDRVIGRLATRYRCLALDLRGHGSSGRPGRYSFELLRDDLLGSVDQLGLERFTLIGHSMGANVAWLFVQDHSDRVERLVIEDTAPPSTRHTYPDVPEAPPEPVSYDWQVRRALVAQLNNPHPA